MRRTLSEGRVLSLLVLGDFVVGVLTALAVAERPSGLGDVDHVTCKAEIYSIDLSDTFKSEKNDGERLEYGNLHIHLACWRFI